MNLLVLLEVFDRLSLKRDLEVAREIQLAMLPDGTWSAPGVEASGLTRPANTVGGDFYDILPRPDGRVIVALGDVAGKASPAALLMALFLAMLRTLVDEAHVAAGTRAAAQHPGVASMRRHRDSSRSSSVCSTPTPATWSSSTPARRRRCCCARAGTVERLSTGGIALAMFEAVDLRVGPRPARSRRRAGDVQRRHHRGRIAGRRRCSRSSGLEAAVRATPGVSAAVLSRAVFRGRRSSPARRTAGRRPHRAGAQPADRTAGPRARPGRSRNPRSPVAADLASNRRHGPGLVCWRAVLIAWASCRVRAATVCARIPKSCRCYASCSRSRRRWRRATGRPGCRSSPPTPTPTAAGEFFDAVGAARRDPRRRARARSRAARRRAAGRRLPADRRGLHRERAARPALHLAPRHPPSDRRRGSAGETPARRGASSPTSGCRRSTRCTAWRSTASGRYIAQGLRPHVGRLRAAAAGRRRCSSPTPPRASPRWCCSATAR